MTIKGRDEQHQTIIGHFRACLARRRMAGIALIGFGVFAGLTTAAVTAEESGAAESLRQLEKLVGSWATDRVEFLDADGTVRQTSRAYAHHEFSLDGNVLVHRGRLTEPPIESRSWYFVSPEDGRLRMGSVTTGGRYDEFAGEWHGDRLVMVSIPESSTGDRLFRMTHADITENAYVESLEVSEDDGKTWQMTSRQTMQRVDPAAILEALQAYTGRWRSDDKTGRDGSRFHFRYQLDWLDAAASIARLVITRVDSGEKVSVVFEGYKGFEPGGEVYYHGASPSGRGARGVVFLRDDDLVTLYDGWTAEGDVVKVRDVFEPVDGDAFTSRTYLRQPGEAEWRQIGEDVWSRIDRAD